MARRRNTQAGPTVTEFLIKWMDAGAEVWSTKTVADRVRRCERRYVPALGERPVAELTAADIEAAVAAWKADDASIRQLLTDLRSALSVAVEWELLAEHPMKAAAKS